MLGFASRNFFRKLFSGKKLEINYSSLASDFTKIFYYNCVPQQKPNESDEDYDNRLSPKKDLFDHIKSQDGFHFYEGTARYRDKKRGQEQKQVDIMIAVDMLTHAFRRNMHAATLLTSDLDFKPLLDALVQDGMYVSLWYAKGKTNQELIDAADSRMALTIDVVKRWVSKPSSQEIENDLPKTNFIRHIEPSWREESSVKLGNHQIKYYKKYNTYIGIVPNGSHEFIQHSHDDFDRLRFYIEHVHSA